MFSIMGQLHWLGDSQNLLLAHSSGASGASQCRSWWQDHGGDLSQDFHALLGIFAKSRAEANARSKGREAEKEGQGLENWGK